MAGWPMRLLRRERRPSPPVPWKPPRATCPLPLGEASNALVGPSLGLPPDPSIPTVTGQAADPRSMESRRPSPSHALTRPLPCPLVEVAGKELLWRGRNLRIDSHRVTGYALSAVLV